MLSTLATQYDALERRRLTFLDALAAEPPAALTFTPAPGAWSLADVAQHLWLVDRGTMHVVSTRLDKPPLKTGALDPLRRLATRLILNSSIRFRAPLEAIVPKAPMPLAQVRAEWEQVRASMREMLEQVTPALMTRPVFRHPISGPMTVPQALDFLTWHHDHHLRQVRRIRRAAGFPGAGAGSGQ